MSERIDIDILERLRGYNPPDRTIDDQRQISVDIQDAAAEIERLRAATEYKSTVEMDGVAYPIPPQVAGLLHAVSEERDAFEKRMRAAELLIREAKSCMFKNCIQHLTVDEAEKHKETLDKLMAHLEAARNEDGQ